MLIPPGDDGRRTIDREAAELSPAEFAAALRFLVEARGQTQRCRIVGVDGKSGSGKTSLANVLADALGAPCLHVDDWVPGWSGLARSVELLVEWVLQPLNEGRPARWRRWDWDSDRFGEWEILAPTEVVVVEGCGAGTALARPWLTALVWICLDDAERWRRLRARPDWPIYGPWAEMWAVQEHDQRAGEAPGAGADAVVATTSQPGGPMRVRWTTAS